MENIFEALEQPLRARLADCQDRLRKMGSVVVAFSAGVDSTFLLSLALRTLGRENVLAAMGVSPSLAKREREQGRLLALEVIGAELVELETDEMSDPNYVANSDQRCYFCKLDLFGRLIELAKKRGLHHVVCGANADDTGDFRPGIQAGKKLNIQNPLLEAGLSKEDIRIASRALGLPTWNKPSMACLSSRIPYGQTITPQKLSRIEQAEYVLKDLGFIQCRVRDHEATARIEIPVAQLPDLLANREAIVKALKELGYKYISADLEGFRSGSMNEVLPQKGG